MARCMTICDMELYGTKSYMNIGPFDAMRRIIWYHNRIDVHGISMLARARREFDEMTRGMFMIHQNRSIGQILREEGIGHDIKR